LVTLHGEDDEEVGSEKTVIGDASRLRRRVGKVVRRTAPQTPGGRPLPVITDEAGGRHDALGHGEGEPGSSAWPTLPSAGAASSMRSGIPGDVPGLVPGSPPATRNPRPGTGFPFPLRRSSFPVEHALPRSTGISTRV